MESEMVSVSASVNLLLHHKVQKFSSGTGSPGWSRIKGRKTVVCVCVVQVLEARRNRNNTSSSRSALMDQQRIMLGDWLGSVL